jgi:hypothetical protein
MHGSQDEIKNPAYWKLIARSMNFPLPVSSPSSNLLSPHRDCVPGRKKYGALSKSIVISILFSLFLILFCV